MGDRASVHISIGGKLLRVHFEALAAHVADYDLRVDWDGEPFDPEAITEGEPLELYGTELNGGLIDEIDTFCVRHGLPFRRWSGGCPGAFHPEIILFEGQGPIRAYMASEDEQLLFSPAEIMAFTRLRDLKRAIARTELTMPPFVLI